MGKYSLYAFIIAAHDIDTVKRYFIHKGNKGIIYIFLTAVMVDMVIIDIGNNVDDREKIEEGTVRFISFCNKVISFAQSCVGAIGIEEPADNDGSIQICGVKNRSSQ